MKIRPLQALLVSGLLLSMSVCAASDQVSINGRDRAWMKQQQQALQEFKNTLSGQTMTLPPAQQSLTEKLQQSILADQAARGNGEKKTFEAIYFVSLGIPREGLAPMLQDAARYNIPATIRGLVNNDFRQTASVMYELSKENKNTGVQIDPTLFADYHISVVPALVVNCPGHSDVIRGSLSLTLALEKVAEKGDCADVARRLLEGTR